MKRALERLLAFAAKSAPLFLSGEAGVGKDAYVRAAFERSPRAGKHLHTVNCAMISPTLKSELFGHQKGAFTGALKTTDGHLHAAHGGGLHLAEALSLPPELQSSLLNVFDENSGTRVGSTNRDQYDFRLFSSSRWDPAELMRKGALQRDYLDRITVFVVEIPPLRDRMEDLAPLVESLLARSGHPAAFEDRFAPDARRKLVDYDWPGNVRELDTVVRRAIAFGGDCRRFEAEHIERNRDIPWMSPVYDAAPIPAYASKRRRKSKWPDEVIRKAYALKQEGSTLAEIRDATGISTSALSNMFR